LNVLIFRDPDTTKLISNILISGKSTESALVVRDIDVSSELPNFTSIHRPDERGIERCKLMRSNKYLICDMTGTVKSDGKSIEDKLAQTFISHMGRSYDIVCYVREYNRFNTVEKIRFNIFYKVFGRHKNHIVIIVNKSNPELLEEKRDIILKQMNLHSSVNIKMIPVNFPDTSSNPVIESYYKDLRKESLQRLEDMFRQIKETNGTTKVDISERGMISGLDDLCIGRLSDEKERTTEDIISGLKKILKM